MTTQEIAVYREIQKSTEHAMRAIDAVSDKIGDDRLSLQLSRQSLKYSELHNAASKQLMVGKAEYYRSSFLEEAKLLGRMQCNTLLNTSTGHMAELMIRESTDGILNMERALRHNENISPKTAELARQLIACEEKNITSLKRYL